MSASIETERTNIDDVNIRWGIRIPMRDGIHLNATLYLPHARLEPRPCIVTLTPYISDSYHSIGSYFASRQFPFLIVDVRGRGNSEGEFRPFRQEARDGYDVVEWLANESYCNGKVAMWGGSYSGHNQWVTAAECPPHLTTIVPAAAAWLGVDFPMRSNVFFPYLMQWLTFTSGRTSQTRMFSDDALWSTYFNRWHRSGRAFRELDESVGNPSPTFQEWLSHPEPGAYWDSCNPTDMQYLSIRHPVLTITGSYDDDQLGALEHHRRHVRSQLPEDRGQHYLIIGPWDHAGTCTPKAEMGGLTLGAASLLDLSRLHFEWYRWVMEGGTKPAFLRRHVAYYVMGAERWRYADSLEEITVQSQPYFLDSGSNAADMSNVGSLGLMPGQGIPDSYTFNPNDVDSSTVWKQAQANGSFLVDQGLYCALNRQQLVYHSAPLERDTEISGFFRLSAWLAINCPDTDFYASVYEIDPNGGSIRLSADVMRARYRQGLRQPRLICTTQPLLFEFERFTFVSRQFKRGHRLRLVVGPMGRLMDTTFAQRNFNGGGVVAEETHAQARPVTVKLFHDAAHPSFLHVPIGQSESHHSHPDHIARQSRHKEWVDKA